MLRRKEGNGEEADENNAHSDYAVDSPICLKTENCFNH